MQTPAGQPNRAGVFVKWAPPFLSITAFGLYSMPQSQVALVSDPHPTQIRREIEITCSVGALMTRDVPRLTVARAASPAPKSQLVGSLAMC
jgi:hypothetical protein